MGENTSVVDVKARLLAAFVAVLWVGSVMVLGFFLGDAFPSLGEQIDKLVIVILAFSLIPIAFEWWRHKRVNAPGAEIGPQDGGPDRDIMGQDI